MSRNTSKMYAITDKHKKLIEDKMSVGGLMRGEFNIYMDLLQALSHPLRVDDEMVSKATAATIHHWTFSCGDKWHCACGFEASRSDGDAQLAVEKHVIRIALEAVLNSKGA